MEAQKVGSLVYLAMLLRGFESYSITMVRERLEIGPAAPGGLFDRREIREQRNMYGEQTMRSGSAPAR